MEMAKHVLGRFSVRFRIWVEEEFFVSLDMEHRPTDLGLLRNNVVGAQSSHFATSVCKTHIGGI